MIEKLIAKVANSQVFSPDDSLSRMVKNEYSEELDLEKLSLVYAARMDRGYDEFLKRVQDRNGK